MDFKETKQKTIEDMNLLIGSYERNIEYMKEDLLNVSYHSSEAIKKEIKAETKKIIDNYNHYGSDVEFMDSTDGEYIE